MKHRDSVNLHNRTAADIEKIITATGDLTEQLIQDLLDEVDAATRELQEEND